MSFSRVGSLGSANDKSAGTSIALAISAAAEAGNLVVVIIALDNTQTTDGNTSEVSSISDSAGGNTWIKAREFCNGQGGAAAGVTVSVWYSVLTNQINNAGTITANFANSITASAITADEFTIGAGNTVVVEATPADLANDGADPGSLTLSSLTSREYLFIRAIAGETNSTAALTPSTGYTAFAGAQTTGGGGATNMGVRGESRILTGTGDSSDPTWTAVDCASVYIAFREQAQAQLAGDAAAVAAATGAISTGINMTAAALSVATALGAISTGVALNGSAVTISVVDGVLTAEIRLNGSALGQALAAAGITTQILLAATAAAQAAMTGALAGNAAAALAGDAQAQAFATGALATGIALDGAALAQVLAAGGLATAIRMGGAAAAQALAQAEITVQIRLDGAAIAVVLAQAGLGTGVQLAGAAQALASGAAALSTGITLVGDAVAVSIAAAALDTRIWVAGNMLNQAQAAGALATELRLAGAAASVVSGNGALTIEIRLDVAALAQALASGDLVTQIRLDGAALAQTAASGALTVTTPLAVDPRFISAANERIFRLSARARPFTAVAQSRQFKVAA